MQRERRKKRKAKKSHKILHGMYRTVVALSAIVVVVYLVFQIAFRPPDMAQAQDDPSVEGLSTEVGPVRKPLCYTFLLAASDDGNGNADTIMVMTFDIEQHTVDVISIPRDTLVETERQTPKMNAAYAWGIENLEAEVEHLVGFPIDYYVTVDMEAFVALVDAVGGIEFDVPVEMYYHDPTQDLSIRYMPGMQYLTGQQALEVARFRKNGDGTGYANSDIGRTQTQQAMLSVIADEVLSLGSLTQINSYMEIFADYVETNMNFNNMLYFASEAAKVDLTTGVSTTTLPGRGDAEYNGYEWCYELDQEACLQILNDYVNPYVDPLTLEDVTFILGDDAVVEEDGSDEDSAVDDSES